MLFNAHTGEQIQSVPHPDVWCVVTSRLSQTDLDGVAEELALRIGDNEVNVAGWIPGSTWEGTPFQIIYEAAAHGD